MPQVRMKGVTAEQVIELAPKLSARMAEITECPSDWVEIEYLPSKVVSGGMLKLGAPFVEVYWFDRGQEQSDAVAKAITEEFQAIGIENVDVAFLLYKKELYYENGVHF